jgi:glycolate oxidase FAD binding subunit
MSAAAVVAHALEEIAGRGHVQSDPAALVSVAVDGVVPRWLVRPGTVEQIAQVLVLASAEGLAVSPRGSGSSLALGNPPRRLDLVLDLGRLTAVLEYVPDDLVASVQCGITLDALAAHLGRHRQRLPLDPAPGGGRSVGGVLATAAAGPLRFRYGTGRDLLLGVRFVQADGVVTWGGARVVKSVTGYDVPKLMVGSLGTLGVLVEATLRLHPIPPAWEARLWTFETIAGAAAQLAAILDSTLQPERVMLLDAGALHAVRDAVPDGSAELPPDGAAVAVSVASTAEAVRAQMALLGGLASERGGEGAELTGDFWSRLGGALAGAVALKIVGEPARLGHWLRQLEHVARDGGVGLIAAGDAGSGVLRAALRRPGGDGLPSGTWLAGAVAGLRAALALEGGSLVVERAPRAVKETLDVWGPVAPELVDVMRRLKHEFDPAGILNPGRFAGGL